MFMQRLLGREPAQSIAENDSAREHDCTNELAAVHRSLTRREDRIAFLRRKLHSERHEHVCELDRKDSEIARLRELLAERTRTASAPGDDVTSLKKELAMVMALLDEFEDDASRAQHAEARVADLEAQCRAKDAVIAALERDNETWQCAPSTEVVDLPDDYPDSVELLVANEVIGKHQPDNVGRP
ncbi:MAG: hypothetical protein HKN70_02520 [Gammaproteobacteria bacterium]|nr:hypothetical protein [Gammaproteobacteria bacterium]